MEPFHRSSLIFVSPNRSQKLAFCFSCLMLFICLSMQNLFAIKPTANDTFYIPDRSNTITINGTLLDSEWGNSNWFTFGTKGYFEVEVHAIHHSGMLYFSFKVFDGTEANKDRIIICIDPTNDGEAASTVLKRFAIQRNDDTEYSTRTASTNDSSYVIGNPGTTFIAKANSNTKFWEAEIKIDLIGLEIDEADFGLFFQVNDFSDDASDAHVFPYYWPLSVICPELKPHQTPFADEWANGTCVASGDWSKLTKPDIFFHRDSRLDLRSDNASDDLSINCDGSSQLFAKIHRTMAHPGNSFPLQFLYSDYGLDCWNNIEKAADVEFNSANSLEVSIDKIEPSPVCSGSESIQVVLRAEHSFPDAITSNNCMIRSYTLVETAGDELVTVPVAANFCEDLIGEVAGIDYHREPVLLASAAPFAFQFPPGEKPETFYFLVDRSGLDTSDIVSGQWEFDFGNGPATGDTVLPSLDSLNTDMYRLTLQPGDSFVFNAEIHVPEFAATSAPSSVTIDMAQTPLVMMQGTPTIGFPPTIPPALLEQIPFTTPPNVRYSSLTVKVYRELYSYTDNDTTYHRMQTLRYFGTDFVIKQKQNPWPTIVRVGIVVVAATVGLYFAIKNSF